MIRTYSELSRISTFEERFKYLQLYGEVGADTFGFDRYLNQRFYKSIEWREARQRVIMRDMGCDLGLKDYPISGEVIVHHMNPMSIEDLETNPGILLDPEFLICVSLETHNAIHYGNDQLLKDKTIQERRPQDTKLW